MEPYFLQKSCTEMKISRYYRWIAARRASCSAVLFMVYAHNSRDHIHSHSNAIKSSRWPKGALGSPNHELIYAISFGLNGQQKRVTWVVCKNFSSFVAHRSHMNCKAVFAFDVLSTQCKYRWFAISCVFVCILLQFGWLGRCLAKAWENESDPMQSGCRWAACQRHGPMCPEIYARMRSVYVIAFGGIAATQRPLWLVTV